MNTKHSIAEARNQLSGLVHRAESGETVTLTRRGRSVAVLLSNQQFLNLKAGNSPGFWNAWQDFSEHHQLTKLDREDFAQVRDRTTGRDIN